MDVNGRPVNDYDRSIPDSACSSYSHSSQIFIGNGRNGCADSIGMLNPAMGLAKETS